MSYFSTALNRLAEQQQLKQADIVRETGLSRSHISRLFSGDPHTLSEENFLSVLRAFGRDPHAQAELIAARCMDYRIGPGAERVEITVKSAGTTPTQKPVNEFPEVHLSKEAERAFAWLRSQCPINPDLEKHLIGYARLTGMK